MPGRYKKWIGDSRRESLLKRAKNKALYNAINQMYRLGSFIGDGGTASVLKFESRTSVLASPRDHIQKARKSITNLRRISSRQNLNEGEKKMVKGFIRQLNRAILEWEKRK